MFNSHKILDSQELEVGISQQEEDALLERPFFVVNVHNQMMIPCAPWARHISRALLPIC
jgi:hypothetical protein